MGYYDKTSLDLLGQRINRDNPDLKATLDSSNIIVLGGPYTSGLGTSGRNTRVVLNGKTGSGVVGKKEFFYDRLNIGALFNGITVVFAAKGDSATVADLLPALNEQYGLGLTAADITNGATKLGTGYKPTPVTLTIAATSLAYTGSLNVIWTRSPVGYFPDSGPGSKYLLVGSLQEGYFGTVTDAELIRTDILLFRLNTAAKQNYGASTVASSGLWYKFAKDNKVYYLAGSHASVLRWTELYQLGAVYEIDTPEQDHHPVDGTIITQDALVNVTERGKSWYLSPCLPVLSETDPWDYLPANGTPNPTGDVARLFTKISRNTPYGTSEWESAALTAVAAIFRNTDKNDPTKYPISTLYGTSQSLAVKATSQQWWVPMLELVDIQANPVKLEDVNYAVIGRPRAPLLTIDASRDPNIPVPVTDIQSTYNLSIRRPFLKPFVSEPVKAVSSVIASSRITLRSFKTYSVVSNPPKALQDVHPVITLRPIGFTATTVVREKINLSTTTGELDGFI